MRKETPKSRDGIVSIQNEKSMLKESNKMISNKKSKLNFKEQSNIANKAVLTRRLNIISRRKFDRKYKDLYPQEKQIVEKEFDRTFSKIQKRAQEQQDKQLSPAKKAIVTWAIATIVTKWSVSQLKNRPEWQLVEFTGENERESTGIIDILAVRKDHKKGTNEKLNLNRGDLLEIILIQVKGGGALMPSVDDIERLLILSEHYNAKHIVLSEWKQHEPVFYLLKKGKQLDKILRGKSERPREAWKKVEPVTIFG